MNGLTPLADFVFNHLTMQYILKKPYFVASASIAA
jgi:hypothetical protein